ncbi:hypothetical protein BJ878DRAFT_545820 [Calycina marina]|uniref:SprT-like domain-containing protein n=1 Tax=Calycina marina TaxID=1763456 RepID=A0A9P7YVR1_9HELO|nr:hypothetical protein BJ878DRAFT_545820 [Calycina marina]
MSQTTKQTSSERFWRPISADRGDIVATKQSRYHKIFLAHKLKTSSVEKAIKVTVQNHHVFEKSDKWPQHIAGRLSRVLLEEPKYENPAVFNQNTGQSAMEKVGHQPGVVKCAHKELSHPYDWEFYRHTKHDIADMIIHNLSLSGPKTALEEMWAQEGHSISNDVNHGFISEKRMTRILNTFEAMSLGQQPLAPCQDPRYHISGVVKHTRISRSDKRWDATAYGSTFCLLPIDNEGKRIEIRLFEHGGSYSQQVSTLFHELLHAIFTIYGCRYKECNPKGWIYSCGESGHDEVWQRVAKHCELFLEMRLGLRGADLNRTRALALEMFQSGDLNLLKIAPQLGLDTSEVAIQCWYKHDMNHRQNNAARHKKEAFLNSKIINEHDILQRTRLLAEIVELGKEDAQEEVDCIRYQRILESNIMGYRPVYWLL